MANFVIISDPNSARREEYLRRMATDIAPLDGLAMGSVRQGQIGVVWAASPRAPLSFVEDEMGVAVVWGIALRSQSAHQIEASDLTDMWTDVTAGAARPLDGFHVAFLYRPSLGVMISADLLGLFPVYYAALGDAWVAGSSPELFTRHPAFEPVLDRVGLVGLLMTHGLLGGRTLLEGVRRLQAGHVLRRWPDGRVEEISQYTIPSPGPLSRLSLEDQVDALGSGLDTAIRRQVAGRSPVGLLLSGGRDTRLLGGYLRDAGCSIDAVTFGRESDYEVRCARAVGRKLGAAHQVRLVPDHEFVQCADLQARWEHLGTGFSTVHTWGMVRWLQTHESPMVSGYLIGRMVGGTSMISEHGPYGQTISFDTAYPLCAPVAIERSTLETLMTRTARSPSIETAFARMREDYETPETAETQRIWRYVLFHYERFHAGAVPWHLSFGAWPILPILDQNLLATIGGLHTWTLANRRGQDQLLCRRFPDLASIILDRNAHNIDPLAPTLGYRARRRVSRWLSRTGLLPRRASPPDVEPRYYYRMYDLNGPGWRSIRARAEPFRETLADLFDMDALRAYLPPPDQPVALQDAIVDGSGRKLLLGFMLWRGRHGW